MAIARPIESWGLCYEAVLQREGPVSKTLCCSEVIAEDDNSCRSIIWEGKRDSDDRAHKGSV